MKRTKAFTKTGQVKATDSTFTGDEPVWVPEDISFKETKQKYQDFATKAFNFYNYYFERADYLYALHEFMIGHPKYTATQANTITSNFPAGMPVNVLGGLARMASRGVPCAVDICTRIDVLLRAVPPTKPNVSEKKSGPLPLELARAAKRRNTEAKVLGVIRDFDEVLDSWIESPLSKVRQFDIVSSLNHIAVDKGSLLPLREYLLKFYTEYEQDLGVPSADGGFSYLSKPALKRRLDELGNMIRLLDSWVKPAKPRKPRKTHIRSAEKQIKTLSFAPENEDFKLKSTNPVCIPGAQHLYVFNVRYKTLNVYHAKSPDGLGVKGSTIQNFDTDVSYAITLRKPKDVLAPVVAIKTPKQIETIISRLTTKKKPATGRINRQCILYRVLATRKPI
jgi:hypothetical protein